MQDFAYKRASLMTDKDIGIPINPKLPEDFDHTPNEERPESHKKWWFLPYIVDSNDGFEIRCLNGGAWDRSIHIAWYETLKEAVKHARTLTLEYEKFRRVPVREAVWLLWHQGEMRVITDEKGNRIGTRPVRPDEITLSLNPIFCAFGRNS